MADITKSPGEYLKKPYSRVVVPDEQSGTYTAQILEFPGCITQGKTPQEAYEKASKKGFAHPIITFVPIKDMVQIY